MIKDDGIMYWVRDSENGEEPQVNELANLKFCNVKETVSTDMLFSFEILSFHVIVLSDYIISRYREM